MDFYLLRRCSGLSVSGCAELFKVSEKTVRNWDNGKILAPTAVILCLQYRDKGLGIFGSQWANFRVMNDVIMDDCKNFVYPHEIRAMHYLWAAAGIKRYQMAMRNLDNVELVSPSASIPKAIDRKNVHFQDWLRSITDYKNVSRTF